MILNTVGIQVGAWPSLAEPSLPLQALQRPDADVRELAGRRPNKVLLRGSGRHSYTHGFPNYPRLYYSPQGSSLNGLEFLAKGNLGGGSIEGTEKPKKSHKTRRILTKPIWFLDSPLSWALEPERKIFVLTWSLAPLVPWHGRRTAKKWRLVVWRGGLGLLYEPNFPRVLKQGPSLQ